MLNMWKADLYRMVKGKGFWLFWLLTLITFAISIGTKSPGGISLGAGLPDTDVKLDVAMAAKNYTFYFLCLLPVFSIVVADFGEKTWKNTISSVISRKSYFISKCSLALGYVALVYVIANIGFYVGNRLVNGEEYASTTGTFLKAVFRQLPLFLGVYAVLLLLAFVVKKAAAFNAIVLIFPFIYTAVALTVYETVSKSFAEKYLLKYELESSLGKLAVLQDNLYFRNCTILGCGCIVVSLILGYRIFIGTEVE